MAGRFLAGVRAGIAASAVLLPGAVLYGAGFGLMAGTVQLSLAESTFFSAWVYAGGAQMASLQGWSYPVPLLFVCLTTLAINARYLLMGATLRPFLAGHHPLAVYSTLFVLGDGNWGLAMQRRHEEIDGLGFML